MRLIDVDAAIKAVEKSMYENPHKNGICRSMHDHEHRHFLAILMGLSPAQPDIIYCKDCIWRNEDNACENMYDRYGFWPEVEPNDFCSWAERREE